MKTLELAENVREARKLSSFYQTVNAFATRTLVFGTGHISVRAKVATNVQVLAIII